MNSKPLLSACLAGLLLGLAFLANPSMTFLIVILSALALLWLILPLWAARNRNPWK